MRGMTGERPKELPFQPSPWPSLQLEQAGRPAREVNPSLRKNSTATMTDTQRQTQRRTPKLTCKASPPSPTHNTGRKANLNPSQSFGNVAFTSIRNSVFAIFLTVGFSSCVPNWEQN